MGNREKGRVDLGINQPGYVREGSIILADRWFSYVMAKIRYIRIFFFFLILDRVRFSFAFLLQSLERTPKRSVVYNFIEYSKEKKFLKRDANSFHRFFVSSNNIAI